MVKQSAATHNRLVKLGKEWDFNHEGTVNNGFPVVLWFNIDKADPEVGYFHDDINDYELTTPTGSSAIWLKVTDADLADLKADAMEAVVKEAKENFNEPDEDY